MVKLVAHSTHISVLYLTAQTSPPRGKSSLGKTPRLERFGGVPLSGADFTSSKLRVGLGRTPRILDAYILEPSLGDIAKGGLAKVQQTRHLFKDF